MNGQRLDPATDGRPDSRPTVRDALQNVTDPISGSSIPVGDLMNDFNFSQKPLAPLILTTQIPVDFASNPFKNQPPGELSMSWTSVYLTGNGTGNGIEATYNLRRSTISGGPYTLVSGCSNANGGGAANLSSCSISGVTSRCCLDPGQTSGATYYYVVTSVNYKGVETPYSTELTLIAP